ncbi:MAG: hypothetical protein J7497_01740 [Chitinophagaceae bacterium]|nr:hypothetical protein [Chitinophagaceae bacterium]
MGLVYANIQLVNFADETLHEEGYLSSDAIRNVSVRAMADSGAIRLAINENVRKQLGLRVRSKMPATLADGTVKILDIAGPIKVKFRDRDCITDAFVLPDNEEVLLGAVPMELMDLVVIPKIQSLEFNPANPDGPKYSLRGVLKKAV